VYRLTHTDLTCRGLTFAAHGALLADTVRRGWNALDVYPVDLAAHLKALGVRRLTARERAEYGPFVPTEKQK